MVAPTIGFAARNVARLARKWGLRAVRRVSVCALPVLQMRMDAHLQMCMATL